MLAAVLAAVVLLGSGTVFAQEDGSAPAAAREVRHLIPVGRAVGIKLFSDGVMVVGFSQIPSVNGNVTPARTCGLREGDIITHINAAEVDTVEEVQAQLSEIGGEKMSIRALRDGKEFQITAQAAQCSSDGCYKLGAWLRDSMAGIGTITYYDPESGAFGALGHGVNDVDTAQLMPLGSGGVLRAVVSDVKKGARGEPGELHGDFDMTRDVGTLTANTGCGIFGTLDGDFASASGEAVELTKGDQARIGPVVIRSNVNGEEVQEYAAEITHIFSSRGDSRDFMLRVTDPALLETTGGIVQGMSGSPVLQDGKLVGAVTHVLLSDPCQGYGIFVERMLEEQENCGA